VINREVAGQKVPSLECGRPLYARRGATHLDDLERRLRETAAWCERNLDLCSIGSCLRPRRIAPHCLPRDRWHSVEDVVTLRRQAIGGPVAGTRRPAAGRLLVYFPELDLTDGAAEVASQEFFDAYNAPPWGTWVACFKDLDRDDSQSSFRSAGFVMMSEPEAYPGRARVRVKHDRGFDCRTGALRSPVRWKGLRPTGRPRG
jgi:hypothetical protein